MFKDNKPSILKIALITLTMSCGMFLYSGEKVIAICAIGTGLSYSGMHLMFKEKEKREELAGVLLFFIGLGTILQSDVIVKAFSRP